MASYLSGFEHLEFQLEEIKTATNNFHDSNVIGIGGFGEVYKGDLTFPEGKHIAAFKHLDRKHGQGDPEFFKEIRMLSTYKHDNLISLLGFCKEGDGVILIYEHASQGSLNRILDKSTLTWMQRLKICLDAAKGLSFLHDPKGTQQKRVLHYDIKSANILLDESLNAKVADFGLLKISPANQQYTLLVTTPAGTPGYCDPLYMYTYQLTKESDVYSFGVVLFEVLCGRVCYEISNRQLKIFVPYWKKCYEQKKLDEIIFPDLKRQMNPSSVRTFVDIAYQCLQESRAQRPKMSDVVDKLKAALKLQEQEQMCKAAAEQEYKEILKSVDPPLRFLEFPVNGGTTLLSINDKGEVICERIYIEACFIACCCLNQCQDPSNFKNTRFPGGRSYYKHEHEMKVHVRAQFLCPQITYSVNLVFRNVYQNCKTLHYKLNGHAKCCMVYDTYKREDGWFVVTLYQFTSDHKTAHFEINFEGFRNGCTLQVAGFEFHPLEENVELNYQWFEEYQEIVKAASQSLLYRSLEELKVLLSIGFHINNYRTWFSLNENGEHSEMLPIAHCLISHEGGYSFYHTDHYSRFPSGIYKTINKGFHVHMRTQFLTPSIRYTVSLVLRKEHSYHKQKYVALKYKLKGETETSIVYLATETKDKCSFIAELYQFTSNQRTLDLEIVFEDHKDDLEVEGILFQPLEKVEHEQVLEIEELSNNSLQWKMSTSIFQWFIRNGQKGYAVDNNGKKYLMFSARRALCGHGLSFISSPESRFLEVAVITNFGFGIMKKIKCDSLTPETTYACYLVYKLTEDQPASVWALSSYEGSYIHLVSPPETPFIGQRFDENTRNPLNRPKLDYVPRQRNDGWMEVKVSEFQTPRSTKTVNINIWLWNPDVKVISGLIIESIELKPNP